MKKIFTLILAFIFILSFQKLIFAAAPISPPGGVSNPPIITNQNTSAQTGGGGGASGSELCPDGKSISTAIGCLNVLGGPTAFIGQLLGWAVGIGGGIAFLLIVYAGFLVMTSSGDPERLKAGQELLTSAISGLILLVFSIFILNFIGVNILGIFKK